ncbi:MucR family transcriptional regulator [Methylobacterium sp. A54F]
MTEETQGPNPELIALAGDIVAAYVSNNSVPVADLPALIGSVHSALMTISVGGVTATAPEEVEKPTPAQVRKSVSPDGIISFIDGKAYKTLKRHLASHGLDPVSYRQRYGLAADYPMVASNYAAQRSALAKQIGLGRIGGLAEAQAAAEDEPKARGRRKAG